MHLNQFMNNLLQNEFSHILLSLLSIPVVFFLSWLISLLLTYLARFSLRGRLELKSIKEFLTSIKPPILLGIALSLYYGFLKWTSWLDFLWLESFSVIRLLLIFSIFWFLYRLIHFFTSYFERSLIEQVDQEFRQREIRTRFIILRRVLLISTVIIGLGVILIQFDGVRELGLSLLTSAGIAGIVIGLAAQKSIGSIISGIQLAITQPVRIGDQVIVQNEWGTVEEIHLTYIVIRIWDLRRLIVPIHQFLEQSFENWTRSSSRLVGSVIFYLDFGAPVDLFREELNRLAQASVHWDRDVCVLQVIDADERAMKMRAIVSAATASSAWDLRCEIREGILTFANRLEGGRFLPGLRWMDHEVKN